MLCAANCRKRGGERTQQGWPLRAPRQALSPVRWSCFSAKFWSITEHLTLGLTVMTGHKVEVPSVWFHTQRLLPLSGHWLLSQSPLGNIVPTIPGMLFPFDGGSHGLIRAILLPLALVWIHSQNTLVRWTVGQSSGNLSDNHGSLVICHLTLKRLSVYWM